MKKIYLYSITVLALAMASCAESYESNFIMEKPVSVIHAEYLASLGALNSAVNRAENPNFKLGLAVSSADYATKGLTYSIALTNFDMVTDVSAMAYSSILDENGAYALSPITDMFLQDAPTVCGGAMLSYNALPKTYLENVISPTFVKGDLEIGTINVADFDTEVVGAEYEMNNGSVATVTADPAGGEGNVLQIGSDDNKARNSYAVITFTLPDGLTVADITAVGFDLYCPNTNSQKRNFVAIVNGARKNYSGDTPEKRGCPLETWARKMQLDLTDVEGLSDEDLSSSELTICLGPNVNSSFYYLDNITLAWSTGEPDKYVEKNEAEKAAALADNFGQWAANVMEAAAPGITDYVVLANPMSDMDTYMLRTADNEIECGNDTTGCFFFNDYMGDNYLKTVTDKLSSAYSVAGGNGTPIFYVSESGLLGNSAKTQRLVDQIATWCGAGAKIDGIAVNLPLVYSSEAGVQAANKQAVTDLFTALAATGKRIRLDNVSMANADAEYYGYVISEYFRLIGSANRAGIIFAGTGDLWKNNARTDVYEAVLNALK